MRKAIKIVVIGFIGLSIIGAIAGSGSKSKSKSKSPSTQPASVTHAVTNTASAALTIGDLPAKATAECNSPTYAGELGGRAMYQKPNGQRNSTKECETTYIQNSELSIRSATNGQGCTGLTMPEGVKLCKATQTKTAPAAAPTAPAASEKGVTAKEAFEMDASCETVHPAEHAQCEYLYAPKKLEEEGHEAEAVLKHRQAEQTANNLEAIAQAQGENE